MEAAGDSLVVRHVGSRAPWEPTGAGLAGRYRSKDNAGSALLVRLAAPSRDSGMKFRRQLYDSSSPVSVIPSRVWECESCSTQIS